MKAKRHQEKHARRQRRKDQYGISLTPFQVFVRALVACILLGTVVFGLALEKIDPLPLDASPLEFDGKNAHQLMWTLSKTYPNRLPWSENRRKAGDWLKQQLTGFGYEPKEMVFSSVIAGKRYHDLRNIYAEKKGTTHPDEVILVLAHYDTVETTVEGAMDDASGVAVVLELARLLADQPTQRTVTFLLTDSEEYGAFWGARTFAMRYGKRDQIVAAASFDFVAPEKQVAILTLCDGLKKGFTPLWLRELAVNSIRSIGTVEARDFMNVAEFALRALLIPPADHGALLEAGIPAFNWVGQNEDFARQMGHYHHTPHDVAEAIEPASFSDYGRAAERFVKSVDALTAIPENPRDHSYWKISNALYLPGWVTLLLHILAFVPFLAYSAAKFGRILSARPRARVIEVFKNEGQNMGFLLISLLVGYVALRLLPSLKIITQYEIFPATQKSVLLYTPDFLAILLVAGCIGGAYWAFRRTFSEIQDSVGYLEIRQAFHGIFLALVIVLAFLANSYLATLLLLPPAYLWMALRARRKPGDRIVNTLLLLGGSITFVILLVALNTVFHVGIFYWYIFLAAAYGLISVYAVVLFFMALTVMIRLFREFVL